MEKEFSFVEFAAAIKEERSKQTSKDGGRAERKTRGCLILNGTDDILDRLDTGRNARQEIAERYQTRTKEQNVLSN